MMATRKKTDRAQRARFIKAAREDEREFDENLKRIAQAKPEAAKAAAKRGR